MKKAPKSSLIPAEYDPRRIHLTSGNEELFSYLIRHTSRSDVMELIKSMVGALKRGNHLLAAHEASNLIFVSAAAFNDSPEFSKKVYFIGARGLDIALAAMMKAQGMNGLGALPVSLQRVHAPGVAVFSKDHAAMMSPNPNAVKEFLIRSGIPSEQIRLDLKPDWESVHVYGEAPVILFNAIMRSMRSLSESGDPVVISLLNSHGITVPLVPEEDPLLGLLGFGNDPRRFSMTSRPGDVYAPFLPAFISKMSASIMKANEKRHSGKIDQTLEILFEVEQKLVALRSMSQKIPALIPQVNHMEQWIDAISKGIKEDLAGFSGMGSGPDPIKALRQTMVDEIVNIMTGIQEAEGLIKKAEKDLLTNNSYILLKQAILTLNVASNKAKILGAYDLMNRAQEVADDAHRDLEIVDEYFEQSNVSGGIGAVLAPPMAPWQKEEEEPFWMPQPGMRSWKDTPIAHRYRHGSWRKLIDERRADAAAMALRSIHPENR